MSLAPNLTKTNVALILWQILINASHNNSVPQFYLAKVVLQHILAGCYYWEHGNKSWFIKIQFWNYRSLQSLFSTSRSCCCQTLILQQPICHLQFIIINSYVGPLKFGNFHADMRGTRKNYRLDMSPTPGTF